MADRKPPGVSWQSWIDKQIEEGERTGAFDDLPGRGKPIDDLDQPRDDAWWIKRKLAREQVEVPLPPQLQLRKDVRDFLDSLPAIEDEATVVARITALNERIREVNRTTVTGPPTTLFAYDVGEIVERWRASRS